MAMHAVNMDKICIGQVPAPLPMDNFATPWPRVVQPCQGVIHINLENVHIFKSGLGHDQGAAYVHGCPKVGGEATAGQYEGGKGGCQ